VVDIVGFTVFCHCDARGRLDFWRVFFFPCFLRIRVSMGLGRAIGAADTGAIALGGCANGLARMENIIIM